MRSAGALPPEQTGSAEKGWRACLPVQVQLREQSSLYLGVATFAVATLCMHLYSALPQETLHCQREVGRLWKRQLAYCLFV